MLDTCRVLPYATSSMTSPYSNDLLLFGPFGASHEVGFVDRMTSWVVGLSAGNGVDQSEMSSFVIACSSTRVRLRSELPAKPLT
jgi:hypothetical protein